MEKGLISVLTPCYNGEAYIHRLLDSVLTQDYPQVEMLVVDDGSDDRTADIVKGYIPAFAEKGYTLKYIYQVNSGQSSAINRGLKLMNGEFLTWPDADDFYRSSDAFSQMVEVLRNLGPDFAAVRCMPTFLEEHTLTEIPYVVEDSHLSLFESCLYSNGFIWPPGNYMVKMELMRKVNPNLEIYTEKHAGQNWQLFLPLFYKYKCQMLKESYFNVLVRGDSHSRGGYASYEQRKTRLTAYENTVIATLKSIREMPNKELNEYIVRIKRKYLKEFYWLSFNCRNLQGIKKYYKLQKENQIQLTAREKVKYIIVQCPCLFSLISRILRKWKSFT